MGTQSHIKIATRGSKLALWQSKYVASLLEAKGFTVSLNIIKTTGDRVQDRFLHDIGGKGLFVRELERSMHDGDSDIAVHSLKDLPAVTKSPFCLPAILKRHMACDALILSDKAARKLEGIGSELKKEHAHLLEGMKIATSSLRRQSLLKGVCSKLELFAVRGNVDTRIQKLSDNGWDGIILAAASLERLGLLDLPYKLMDIDWFIPCAAQGALAIECLEDHPLRHTIAELSDQVTYKAASIERAVLAALGGDCTMPVGIHASEVQQGDGKLSNFNAVVSDYEGYTVSFSLKHKGALINLDTQDIAGKIVLGLKANGLDKTLEQLKKSTPDLGDVY